MAGVNFNYWLTQKYNQLQQQADATTQNAATNALTGKSAAALDDVKTRLLPTESAASVNKTNAETGLIGQQAKYFGPEIEARIAQMRADAGYTTTQDKVLQREGLMTRTTLPSSLSSILGARGYTGFSLDDALPARRAGETGADYLDRINGL